MRAFRESLKRLRDCLDQQHEALARGDLAALDGALRRFAEAATAMPSAPRFDDAAAKVDGAELSRLMEDIVSSQRRLRLAAELRRYELAAEIRALTRGRGAVRGYARAAATSGWCREEGEACAFLA